MCLHCSRSLSGQGSFTGPVRLKGILVSHCWWSEETITTVLPRRRRRAAGSMVACYWGLEPA